MKRFRIAAVGNGTSIHGLSFDFMVMISSIIVLVLIGAKLYPTVAR